MSVKGQMTSIGRYRCLDRVGVGAVGAIWKVLAPENNIRAIKLMHPHQAIRRKTRAEFNQEYKISCKLKHPQILQYYEMDNFEDKPYFVMDYFAGHTLDYYKDKSRQGPQLLEIFAKIADGLQYLHEQNFIHRDIKPANILVNDQDNVKIIDFSTALSKLRAWMPFMSKTAGTPSYMSPEQIHGKRLTVATDIYALGTVIFEIIVGRAPFTESSDTRVLEMHIRDEAPKMSKYRRDVSTPLDRLVASMLEKDPEKRPQDMKTIAFQLRKTTLTIPGHRDITTVSDN